MAKRYTQGCSALLPASWAIRRRSCTVTCECIHKIPPRRSSLEPCAQWQDMLTSAAASSSSPAVIPDHPCAQHVHRAPPARDDRLELEPRGSGIQGRCHSRAPVYPRGTGKGLAAISVRSINTSPPEIFPRYRATQDLLDQYTPGGPASSHALLLAPARRLPSATVLLRLRSRTAAAHRRCPMPATTGEPGSDARACTGPAARLLQLELVSRRGCARHRPVVQLQQLADERRAAKRGRNPHGSEGKQLGRMISSSARWPTRTRSCGSSPPTRTSGGWPRRSTPRRYG